MTPEQRLELSSLFMLALDEIEDKAKQLAYMEKFNLIMK